MKLRPQIDRSVSVSVGVIFGLTTPTLSSGIGEGSLFSPGRIPTTTDVDAQEGTNALISSFADVG